MDDRAHFQHLRFAYDAAFEQLRSDVRALSTAECQADRLRQRVHEAEVEYRSRRDDLAEFILRQQEAQVCATCGQ